MFGDKSECVGKTGRINAEIGYGIYYFTNFYG